MHRADELPVRGGCLTLGLAQRGWCSDDQRMFVAPDDPATLQAMIFVREFEAIAERLVADLESPRLHPVKQRTLLVELREVREQIRRLQLSFRLPVERHTA